MQEPSGAGARPVDRAQALPLWAQVHADLRRRIEDGEFAAMFPGELALIDEYRVSRHTVREALRRLRDDGVVVAERGRPPRLAGTPEIEQPVGALYSLFASVEAAGQEQRSVVRRLEVRADGVVAVQLGLEESTPLIYLERLRLADGEPLAVDRVWLPAAVATPLLEADFTHTALYTELAARCGVRPTGGRENIRAVIPTPAERAQLGIDDTVAAFAVERLADHHGQPLEWRTTLVRGDRFSVTAAFSARTGYQLGLAGHAPRQRPRGLTSMEHR
ncbi:GntR family transcriptional regulator [Mangrovihabitans endophyticus]|uniref:GntR family transcriptional regulator n=1 Tax=Mangrovihabitans endophyticus TaxID=1751298 RepID=A0A8J3C4Z8_9ACTN|nr:GntR family transcriptional regulator [Mangrovihabitans endophyticus]GGL10299.1 GntR family transcriptional regulator [Mangrovihabitans endophyticus]